MDFLDGDSDLTLWFSHEEATDVYREPGYGFVVRYCSLCRSNFVSDEAHCEYVFNKKKVTRQ